MQAIENSNILLEGVTKTIKNETKEEKGGFFFPDNGSVASRRIKAEKK